MSVFCGLHVWLLSRCGPHPLEGANPGSLVYNKVSSPREHQPADPASLGFLGAQLQPTPPRAKVQPPPLRKHSGYPSPSLAAATPSGDRAHLPRRPPAGVRARSRSRGGLLGASMRAARLHPRAPSAPGTARSPARFPVAAIASSAAETAVRAPAHERRLTCIAASKKLGRALGAGPPCEVGVDGVGAWGRRELRCPVTRYRGSAQPPGLLRAHQGGHTRGGPPARIPSSALKRANLEADGSRDRRLSRPGHPGASVLCSPRNKPALSAPERERMESRSFCPSQGPIPLCGGRLPRLSLWVSRTG